MLFYYVGNIVYSLDLRYNTITFIWREIELIMTINVGRLR